MKKRLLPVVVLPLLLLNSCLGLSMDIDMRSNGSGRITLEYRVSNMAEAIGALDGNERWPTIPVGRADWERTVERFPGLSLVSFSRREGNKDTVYNVRLDFVNLEALSGFLDSSGRRAAFSQNNLNIILLEPVSQELNPDLIALLRQISAGYSFSMNINTGSPQTTMIVTDGTGTQIQPPSAAQTVLSGRKVSLAIDTGELLNLPQGLGVIINFP